MGDPHFLVCGGCGFLGSNFVRLLRTHHPNSEITILDVLTYAGSIDNLGDLIDDPRIELMEGDIADDSALDGLKSDLAAVVNFAAETHNDRSLYRTVDFVRSNTLGVANLLVYCREQSVPFLQISTDEVYGPTPVGQSFDESARLNPTSPYAASKAAGDLLVLSAIKTFGQKAAIVRTCNNYGPHQFPEKIIPFFVYQADQGKNLPLYGEGSQRRCWIHVEDFCNALLPLMDDFPAGEVLNIGSEFEIDNLTLSKMILLMTETGSEIAFVTDRPAHDGAYRLNSSKFEKRYGKIRIRDFESGLKDTIAWYRNNVAIFSRLDTAESREFLERHYGKGI
jgi:dTDP-glucose 4,6-dehydratase